jgi:hypothetical protein
VIGLEGGEHHHSGTDCRSLLIESKDRVPNRRVRTIHRLLPGLVGSTLMDRSLPDAEPGRLQPAGSPMAAIRRSRIRLVHPLYRPRDNLAMLHGGLAKLMRMSMRNMW